MSIDCRSHEHIRAQIRAQSLHILDQFAEEESAVKFFGDIPDQLGENTQKRCDQVGDAEMQDEKIHPG